MTQNVNPVGPLKDAGRVGGAQPKKVGAKDQPSFKATLDQFMKDVNDNEVSRIG